MMNSKLERELLTHGASLVGFADIAKVSREVTNGLPRAGVGWIGKSAPYLYAYSRSVCQGS